MTLNAPFPWMGGKSRAAGLIWPRFGAVVNYVEPFAGSLAVLLARPDGWTGSETVNDADGFIANFWRALAADPHEVARYADWPVNENDQHARHLWLVEQRTHLTARLEGDPAFYDAKVAGWWVWGICCWIGAGWCSGDGPWGLDDDRKLVHLGDAGRGVHRQLVHLGDAGRGVHRQLVHLGDAGQGVHRQLVHLGNAGQGVHRQRVHLGDAGQGEDGLLAWMSALADRLQRVRVCCGDWSRVCGPTPTVKQGLTGVLLDPPYSDEAGRQDDLYAVDSGTVAVDVRAWALEHGNDPRLRIALCGYDTEHVMPGWTAVPWKAHGGYGSQGEGQGRLNAHRETIWFSPHCRHPEGLLNFDAAEENRMRLTLIDLSSLAFPIWHMSQSDPNPNAVADQLVARVRSLGDDHTAICCDAGRSFRNDISADYKANRKPEDRATLYHQIDLALDRLRGDGFPIWFAKGFEADDIIASACNKAAEDGHDIIIVSADKDLLQLITDAEAGVGSVAAKSIKTGDIIDEAAVEARFGVKPSQMRDWLTIVGDQSDNVKGVAGIGEKGAAALLGLYGSLDRIYAELDTLGLKPSQVLALKAFESRFHEVRTLITLRTDAPVPFDDILMPRVPNDVPPLLAEEDDPMPDEPLPDAPDDIDDAMPTIPVPPPPPNPAPEPPGASVASAEPAAPVTQAPPVKKPTGGTLTVLNGHEVDWKDRLEPTSMEEACKLAKLAFDSKQFGAYGTPQAVLMSLLAGRELGLSAMASLRAVHIIDGKPTMSADLMRSLVIKSGAAKYFRCTERTADQSTWETQRGDDPPISLTFTMEDAKTAGVIKPNSGWVKFAPDMLVARASSKLARLVYPDILFGVFTEEEIKENRP